MTVTAQVHGGITIDVTAMLAAIANGKSKIVPVVFTQNRQRHLNNVAFIKQATTARYLKGGYGLRNDWLNLAEDTFWQSGKAIDLIQVMMYGC